ncbi:endonuclease/exonuclease/phosphatase family protein [Bernardetia sp. OM2101]|uniref:endonuclease/exonuclease/phosphatase family protein n=1 Tax=Bernardetia sp. OM2101 TaxID=3344876 RepID=UPI0035CF2539
MANFFSLVSIWIGDLFSHFRIFWVVFSIIFLIIYIILFNRKKVDFKVLISIFASLFINLFSSYSFWTNSQTYEYLFFGSPTVVEYSKKVKKEIENDTTVNSLLLINVLSSNTNYEKVRELIKNTDADFVVIIELNQKWEDELKKIKTDYPYKFTEVREDNFGMGIYSKEKYQDTSKIRLSTHIFEVKNLEKQVESILETTKNLPIEIQITTKNNYTFFISHPMPPISINAYRNRNNKLDQISEILSKLNSKVIFVGDLNCSPFSSDYKKFLKQSSLKDSQENFGFQPTWNSSFPFLMQTQLDHVWHSEGIEILHRQTLPIEGSDHKAVLVVFR